MDYSIFLATLEQIKNERYRLNEVDLLLDILRDMSILSFAPDKLRIPFLADINYVYGLAGMDRERGEIMRGIVSRPEEFGVKPQDKCTKMMYELFDGNDMFIIGLNQLVSTNIKKYQRENNISSMYKRFKNINDITLEYLDFYDNLELLECDRNTIKSQIPDIISFWRNCTLGYSGYEEISEGEYIPLMPGKVDEIALKAHYADVYTESIDWVDMGDGKLTGRYAEREKPDKISLMMQVEDKSYYFVALNK